MTDDQRHIAISNTLATTQRLAQAVTVASGAFHDPTTLEQRKKEFEGHIRCAEAHFAAACEILELAKH